MKQISISFVKKVLVAGFFLACAAGGLVVWHASRAMHSAAEQVRSENDIPFTVRPLPQALNSDFEVISSPAIFFQAAQFQGHLYLAGPTGLSRYDADGKLAHQYAAGQELPGSPLVAMAKGLLADSSQQELVLATAENGLIAFNGKFFRQILPQSADARAITAIRMTNSGQLLVGTKKRGVLVYDGKQIRSLHPKLDGFYVTCIAGSDSDLWIGTLDRGVVHFHGGEAEGFGETQGLPDARVLSLSIAGGKAYVGTASGVAVFSEGHFVRTLAPGVLATAVLATQDQLYVGSEDQGVVAIPFEGRRPNPAMGSGATLAQISQLFASEDAVLAVARGGLFRLPAKSLAWKQVLQINDAVLHDRNISALAVDPTNRLWVGYFDRGVDLLSADRSRAVHVENEHVFCVNRILVDSRTANVDVATANGLVRFDPTGNERQVLTRSDGLIADHVTDVAAYRDGLALATPAGLTFLDASGARSMYAFHGLVSNHVYALGVSGDELLAGTLGGLSILNRGNVAANYTTATSNLKHNWITAVVPLGSEWMVGTYGAGVLGLDGSGHFRTYENASGPTEINPNAMLVTANHVFAGTLGKGLYLYDRQSGRWSVMKDGLPSSNVTALAQGNGYIYVGTDNGLVRIAEEKLHL